MSSIANLTRQSGRLMPQTVKQVACFSTSSVCDAPTGSPVKSGAKPMGVRFEELQKMLRMKAPTWNEITHYPYQEPKGLRPWPKGINPHTGEAGGPTGPEPTRYGDWERRGRCSDF